MHRILVVLAVGAAVALAGCNHHTAYPTDTQTPTLSPAPTNSSNTNVTQQSCPLPPGNGSGEGCGFEDTKFLEQVENAIDRTIKEHPEYFDLNDGGPCGRCYRILDPGGYEHEVVKNIEAQGDSLCAFFDGEEFAVKNTNDFNEQFDLETADLHIRRQGGSYRATCRPAWF
jgi:hypothetical protein